MTYLEFTVWLDGFLSSIDNLKELNEWQTSQIKNKLSTVFNKVTSNLNNVNKTQIY